MLLTKRAPCMLQYMSVIVWMIEDYYSYSCIVFAITLGSILTNVATQYKVDSGLVAWCVMAAPCR